MTPPSNKADDIECGIKSPLVGLFVHIAEEQ